MFKHYGKLRGRDLFFDYIGTGRGHGPYVELIDGSVKLDFINGIGVNVLGHSHPDVLKASVCGALSDIVMQGNLQPNSEYGEALDKLVEIGSRQSQLKYAWLTTCGAMAGENALKMARQKTNGARKIIAMENAFAGRSTMMAEITDNPAFRQGLPVYNEVLRIPFYDKNDPESSKKALVQMKNIFRKIKMMFAFFALSLCKEKVAIMLHLASILFLFLRLVAKQVYLSGLMKFKLFVELESFLLSKQWI